MAGILLLGLSFAWACGFDNTLREYLDVHFWLPFAKTAHNFEKPNVRRVSVPYAGMGKADASPLGKLRAAYQRLSAPADASSTVVAARADRTLTQRDREETELIDAKLDMRAGDPDDPALLRGAQEKLEQFLQSARTPEWLSEARGWLAYIHHLKGEQTEAGKIYLDELNRDGSNLSRETLLNSLKINYGYTGDQELLDHLEEYFDTAEHAAFAIQLVTNPRWERNGTTPDRSQIYAQVNTLLQKHASILGSPTLAVLTMRIALSMGDPAQAIKLAERVGNSQDPDYLWILGSAHFVSRDYAGAEAPLLQLFSVAKEDQKAAAAYGLCGVYQKLNLPVEQLRFALWLFSQSNAYWNPVADTSDFSVYWASSGFDLNLLLDSEVPLEALTEFLERYPGIANTRLVKYALAVRLARENRYAEAAQIYEAIGQKRRGPRMRELAALWADQTAEGKYKFAEYVGNHSDGIYFNDSLWNRLQSYALIAGSDSRLTREERESHLAQERKLRDDQEELWRAHLILREVMEAAGHTELGIQSAKLAQRDLRRLSERFGRLDEIQKSDIELTRWLR
jgi:hypothetical protein